ncbi:hypothetical protein ACG7TL_003376 [Trametes sanguinea]
MPLLDRAISYGIFFLGLQHKATGATLPPLDTIYNFDQLIDHENPSLGTFKQRFWFSYQYYEPGGPIVLFNPGEEDASRLFGCLTNQYMTGYIAEAFHGAVIVLEHRFFGESNPYPDLSVKSFRVHTIQQAIDDHEYFAKNVKLPMPGGDQLGPEKAPWILVGGSYSGALTSYTMASKPGLFYAGYASSAVVQAIADYWAYYEPIREFLPANCSADIQAVIAFVDQVLTSGNADEIQDLKDRFGLGDVTHDDDFAHALVEVYGAWQNASVTTPGGGASDICDALEVDRASGKLAGPEGWGLDHALAAWGAYYNETLVSRVCEGVDAGLCFDSYDAQNPAYTNVTVNNWARSWEWLLCTQFGWWQVGAPASQPSIVSRLVDRQWNERQCVFMFPEAFSSPPVVFLDALRVNQQYGGWNTTTERLIFVNGLRDPWREATVAADGATSPGWDMQPHLLGDGYHTSDLFLSEGVASPAINATQRQALEYLAAWLSDWQPSA